MNRLKLGPLCVAGPHGLDEGGAYGGDVAGALRDQKVAGDYGLPSIEPAEVELPTLLATESTLKSEVIRLMPTIQGSPASHIYLRLQLPDKTLQEFDITAPKMNVGGKYELRFKYEEMQPKMNLEATINGWTNLNNEVETK